MKRVIALVMLIFICSAAVQAFDGQRKGFILGGGLGFGYAGVSIDDVSGADMDNAGASLVLAMDMPGMSRI